MHQGAECTALARPELIRWLKIPGEKVPVEREAKEGRREGGVPGLSECGGGGGSGGRGGAVAGETADPLLPQHCSDSMKPSFSWPTGSTSAYAGWPEPRRNFMAGHLLGRLCKR